MPRPSRLLRISTLSGLALLLLLGLSPALTGGDAPPNAPVYVPDLTGEWAGYWESDSNGHTGPIRARFERLNGCRYRVTFCGRFCVLLPFRYVTELQVTGWSHGCVCLSGSHHLGPIFGTFSYNARATHTRFVSRFSAADDHGKFVMTRCCD